MNRIDPEIWSQRWEEAQKHPWLYIKHFFITLDHHEKDLSMKLVKPFPARAIFRIVIRAWMEFDIFFLEKFRQGQFTWLFSGLNLWEAMTVPGTMTFFQSKKQDDSNEILERSRHSYEFIFKLGQSGYFDVPRIKMTGDKLGNKESIIFPSLKSEVRAIPQGGDIIRSHTCSRLFSDESEFQPEFGDAYSAGLPTIMGGGKLNSISTVNGKGFVWRKLNGLNEFTNKPLGEHLEDSKRYKPYRFRLPKHLNEEQRAYWIDREICDLPQNEFDRIPFAELVAECPGIHYWKTVENIDSIAIDHWADPDKSPQTTRGKIWVDFWSKALGRSAWEQEMLRRRDRFKGRPVVLNWSRHRFVRDFPYDDRNIIYGAADFGTSLCGCLLAQLKKFPDFTSRQIRFIDEVILENSNTPELAKAIVRKLQSFYFAAWQNNLLELHCDPAGHQERETTSDKSQNTSIKIFNTYGLFPATKKFGKVETTELIETIFDVTLPNGEPAVLIHPRCEYLIECAAGGLHFPESGRDGYYAANRHSHGGDMLRYMFANVMDEYDVGGQKRQVLPRPTIIRRKYTAEIVGRKRSTRINPRRGQHAVRVG